MAVVAKGDLGVEAMVDDGLPRDVGSWNWGGWLQFLQAQPCLDCMPVVLHLLVRDLREVSHPLAVALSRTMAPLAQTGQVVWGSSTYLQPVVEAGKTGQKRLLGGFVVPRTTGRTIRVAEGVRLFPAVQPQCPILNRLGRQKPAAGQEHV